MALSVSLHACKPDRVLQVAMLFMAPQLAVAISLQLVRATRQLTDKPLEGAEVDIP